MEIAQLGKSTYMIISFSNPGIIVTEICLKCGSRKHFGRAKIKGYIMVASQYCIYIPTNNPVKYDVLTKYTLWFPGCRLDKI